MQGALRWAKTAKARHSTEVLCAEGGVARIDVGRESGMRIISVRTSPKCHRAGYDDSAPEVDAAALNVHQGASIT